MTSINLLLIDNIIVINLFVKILTKDLYSSPMDFILTSTGNIIVSALLVKLLFPILGEPERLSHIGNKRLFWLSFCSPLCSAQRALQIGNKSLV